jgi:hypothetical protein
MGREFYPAHIFIVRLQGGAIFPQRVCRKRQRVPSIAMRALRAHPLAAPALKAHTFAAHTFAAYAFGAHTLAAYAFGAHTLAAYAFGAHTLAAYAFGAHTFAAYAFGAHTLGVGIHKKRFLLIVNADIADTKAPHRAAYSPLRNGFVIIHKGGD